MAGTMGKRPIIRSMGYSDKFFKLRHYQLYSEHALVKLFNSSQAHYKYSEMIPLPVTKGYLQIAGFEPYLNGYHRAGLYLQQEDTGFYMRQAQAYVSNKPILSVHHLENLYYSLTAQLLPDSTDE